jgi:TP901 family phage tail tape measure protein
MARNPVTRIIITAKDEASAVFSGLRAHAGKIATAIAGYFGAKLFGDIVGSARDFESAMSAVQAASGASGAELTKLRAAAEEAGATTKYTSVEAANALENLAKSGLSASQAVEALPAVLNLASAGGVELGTAAEFITKAVNGMGLSFGEAGRVADVLAMGANASNTSVTGLAQALSYAAPLANSLGLSLEQTVAIIGKFADAGIDAGRAGTALNSILAQFSDPASKFRRALADAGITTSDFDQALRQLAAAGPAGQKAINAVGQEAGPALRALLNQGIGSLDSLKAKLDESAGSAATFAKVMSDNLDGAAKGFGSAWDALLIKVGTPVLDTLKNQINAVSERLRAFVTDGTATAFGNAIKTAFEAAGRWVQEFVSKVDFKEVSANLQSFASRAIEIFDAIGARASASSQRIQTAYGVMSAGINTVLVAIYKLGQGMSWLTSAFLSDLSTITQGLAKITFGDISAGFAQASASMREQAQAAYSVFEAFGQKASEAFDAAAEGAELAREGFSGLTTTAVETTAATTAVLQEVEQQAGLTAEQVAALGDGAVVMGGKVLEAGNQAAVAAGNVQTLATAAGQAATGVASLEANAEQVASAFERLGVTSTEELQRIAKNAKRDFEIIRNSGTASTEDIRRAFVAYAEKAITANNGVADATIRAQAQMYRLKLGADDAGRSIFTAMGDARDATDRLADSAEDATAKYIILGQTIENLPSPPPPPPPGGTPPPGAPPGAPPGKASSYRLMSSGEYELLARAEQLGGLALRKKYKADLKSIGKAAAPGGVGLAGINPRYMEAVRKLSDRLDAVQIKQERDSGRYETNKPRVVDQQPREQVTTYRVQIGTGSGRTQQINTASRQDADALVELLRQLEADMSRS